MTTWKDGGDYGGLCQEITNEDGVRAICAVWTRKYSLGKRDIVAWPEGEANFRLILQAPLLLEALNMIAEGAIVSPDQSPGGIAESVLRVLQLVREENCKYLLLISAQQKRAERAEGQASQMLEVLEAICNKAEQALLNGGMTTVRWADWEAVRGNALAAIAAVKGEDEETNT